MVSLGQYRLVPAAHTQQQAPQVPHSQHKPAKQNRPGQATTEPAKQKQATGQIRIGTPEINNTAQASSQHHLPGKSTTRAKVKLTTIPFTKS